MARVLGFSAARIMSGRGSKRRSGLPSHPCPKARCRQCALTVLASGSQPLIVRIPQRLVFLHHRLEAVAEDLDLDGDAGLGEIGTQHAERDRFFDAMAPAA